MPKLAKYKDCTGCMACVDSCHHQALQCSLNKEGHIVPVVDENTCINCGACEKTCPVVSKLEYTTSPLAKAYAGWAKDDVVRQVSATAGTFAAMAQYVLSIGGYVCGAAIVDGIYVKHICIDKLEDLYLLQGSKYTQSDATGIYKTVYNHLKDSATVLFSGTGCQMAGLYGFLRNRKYNGILFTVDLICGGVPSRLLIDKFIENEPYKVKRIVSFRSKENGWSPRGFKYNLKVEDSEGQVHDYTGKRNLITTGFACEMTNRYSCYKCQFAGVNRRSDFTIGDFWGIERFKEENHGGISAMIVHNQQGVEFLKKMKDYIELHDASIQEIVTHNLRIDKCYDRRFKLPERRLLAWFFTHLEYKTIKKIYSLDFNNYSPWILYKLYRVLASKLLR